MEIWRAASGAGIATGESVTERDVEGMVGAEGVAVEDLHAGFDEAALFHLINLARERTAPLLLTSRVPPPALGVALPDLASRLRAAHLVALGAPDDDLLRRVLVKLFADRQLSVDPSVVDTIVVRMERSLAAANRIVEALDRAALAEGRGITRRLAAAVVGRLPNGADEPE